MTALRAALAGAAALVVACGAAMAGEAAAAPSPARAALAFDKFLKQSSPICSFESSRRCVDVGWAYADANHDGTLSLAEVRNVRAALQKWLDWKGGTIPVKERNTIVLGLVVLDVIGTDNIFKSLNTSHDGKLTRAELLADVKLDDRPLGQVLQDPKSVDRKALAAKLGKVAPVVSGMLEPKDKTGAPPK